MEDTELVNEETWSSRNPEKQLDRVLAKYAPEIASLARRAGIKMRKRLAGSFEMVYDNHNAMVIGLLPNERPSDAIFLMVLSPGQVRSKCRQPRRHLWFTRPFPPIHLYAPYTPGTPPWRPPQS